MDDLWRLRKLAVVQIVARFDLGEIDDRDFVRCQFLLVGRLLRINGAQSGNIAPDTSRNCEGAIITGHEKCKARTLFAHIGDLRAENVDVDVRRRQHDILELARKSVIADGHLAQGFECKPVAHRMREDRDLLHLWIARQILEQAFHGIARIVRAFAIVAIGQKAAARWPRCEHRHTPGT
ncbi:hypothetical protein D9M68_643200 [compost metagenome]